MGWTTVIEYVDVTTGELINKKEAVRNYDIKKATKPKYEYRGKDSIRKYTHECKPTTRIKLFND